MHGPFPLAETILRLKTQAPLLKTVGNAADLRTATDQKLSHAAMPAAFIVRQERAVRTDGASGDVLIQHVDVDLIVVLYVRNQAAEAIGAHAAADMDRVIAQVRCALLNWTPLPEVRPIVHNASRDQAYQSGTLIAQELFKTRYRIEVRP